jgi:hypothetical protein
MNAAAVALLLATAMPQAPEPLLAATMPQAPESMKQMYWGDYYCFDQEPPHRPRIRHGCMAFWETREQRHALRLLDIPTSFDEENENSDVLWEGREFHPPHGRVPAYWSKSPDVVWPSPPESPQE